MAKSRIRYVIASAVGVAVLGYLFIRGNISSPQPMSSDANKVRAAVSFYPLYFFTQSIGGQNVQVKTITPSGVEPHDYDPSARDIAYIETSSLLVLNGGVEPWGDKIRANLKGTGVMILIAGEGLFSRRIEENGDDKDIPDPHVWLDPMLAKQEAHTIAEGLIRIDPAHASYYERNEQELDTRLDAIDALYRDGLSNCAHQDIVTSHAAFGYLAARYGLGQVAIAGLSPDEEPSARQLVAITDFVRKNNIKFIFFESLVSPKLAQTVAVEAGAQTLVLDPIEGLSDNDIQTGKNYITVMQDNLNNLRTALECR